MENNNQNMKNTNPASEPVTKHEEPVTQKTQTVRTHVENLGARRIVAAIFGLIEILIALRFALKLFGANINNGFVKFMNAVTGIFVALFKGIFPETSIGSGDAVFEPASIVALIVVALIAWFVLRLMTRNNEKRTDQTSVKIDTGTNNH
jgi:uncharacterized membrane protein